MVKQLKKKKKIWYTILASKEFNNFIIGETTSSSPNSLVGRKIRVPLSELIKNPKKQNLNITFSITQVKENADTEIVNYELSSSFIKRIVKPGKDKIDDSFIFKTKDDITIKVKPLLITKSKTKKSILTLLRKKTRDVLKENFEKQTFSAIISSLISYKLQKTLKDQLKKIYPLRTCEIRVLSRKL